MSATAEQDFADLLARTNQARRASGLGPLQREPRLDRAAQRHCEDLAAGGFLSHGGSDGSSLSQRVEATGYVWQALGENVLCRTQADTPQAFMQWWNSDGHRANLLGPQFSQLGFGRAYSANVDCWYYVMVLAAPG